MVDWFRKVFVYSYKSELERYIISHVPQNVADVERLTQEFNGRTLQPWI